MRRLAPLTQNGKASAAGPKQRRKDADTGTWAGIVGARVHTSRVSRERTDKNGWRSAFFLVASLIPILVVALVFLAFKVPKTEVFAIQRDSAGNVVPLGPVTELAPPTVAEQQVALTRWLQDAYMVTDAVTQKSYSDRVYGMVAASSNAYTALQEIYQQDAFNPDSLRRAKLHTEVIVKGVDRGASDNDYNAEYYVNDVSSETAGREHQYHLHAHFTTEFADSVDTGLLWKNPWRVFITSLAVTPLGS